jgi:hypothetical protein
MYIVACTAVAIQRPRDGPIYECRFWQRLDKHVPEKQTTKQRLLPGCSAVQALVKVKLSLYRPWRPIVLREVEAPTFPKQSAHRWRYGCQPYALAAF